MADVGIVILATSTFALVLAVLGVLAAILDELTGGRF